MKIGVIVAMEKELKQLRTLLDNERDIEHDGRTFYTGTVGGNDVVAMQCGIGKVNSTVGAVEMIRTFSPDIVMSTGVAGGADITLSIGDVVVSTRCAYHDAYCGTECEYGQILGMPTFFKSPESLTKTATSLSCTTHVVDGLIVSGEWFVDTTEKMRDILAHFPEAKAVDMESCSIAHTCRLYGVPFISFRIISDIPLKENNTAQYNDFWTSMADGSFEVTRAFLTSLS